MNKTEFNNFLRFVLAKSVCGKPIRAEWASQLMPKLQEAKPYAKRALRPDAKLMCVFRKFGPKKQKFLMLTNDAGDELIIAKGKLLSALYPSKSKQTPEQKHRAEVLKVMRNIIKPQIKEFRIKTKAKIVQLSEQGFMQEARELNKCKLSGRSLNSCKTAVDHITPFVQLVDNWLIANSLTFDAIALKGRGQYRHFADADLATNWFTYHAQYAELQMACSRANSKAGKKGYIHPSN